MTTEEMIMDSFWNLMHFYPITLHADRDIIGRELVIELEKVAKEAHAAGFAEGIERAAKVCDEECAERIHQLQPHQSNPPGKGE